MDRGSGFNSECDSFFEREPNSLVTSLGVNLLNWYLDTEVAKVIGEVPWHV